MFIMHARPYVFYVQRVHPLRPLLLFACIHTAISQFQVIPFPFRQVGYVSDAEETNKKNIKEG